MLEQEAHKRPRAKEVQLCLKNVQQGKKGAVLSSFWGLLIGSLPYLLILLLNFILTSSLPFISFIAILYMLYAFFLCTWPFVLVGQLIMAIRFLFFPPRRLMGLGMLTMLVFLAVAILLGWLPSPFSSLLGFFN